MQKRTLKLIIGVLTLLGLMAPLVGSSPASGQPATEAAHWRPVKTETFEGAFPSGLWVVRDNNGTGATWDDQSSHASQGTYSAHPDDGATPIPVNTSTSMTYGPFSVANASNVRVLFDYELAAESGYDFLRWGYSCTGSAGPWTEVARSGTQSYRTATIPMRACRHQTQVLVRWTFTTDQSIGSNGAYVDNIRIQKFF